MDVSNETAVDSGVANTVSTYGGVDILISNAGIQTISPLVDLSLADWRKLLAIHLDGAFLCTRACMPAMLHAGRGGSMIYMGSLHSHAASPLTGQSIVVSHGWYMQ